MPNRNPEHKHLTDEQLDRYAHHIILKDIGGEGQRKLMSSKVLIVGVGGLGSPAALYLAAAGVGTIGIADDDVVELSNLQRQIVHFGTDLGKKKVLSAHDKLASLNPDVVVTTYDERLTQENALPIISDYDFVIDGTDNFQSKFLINDTCVRLKKSFSHAGVVGFGGQVFTHVPGSMCMRCVFTEDHPKGTIRNCRGSGVVGAAAGVVGSIQAAEAVKHALGNGDLLTDTILTIDLIGMKFRTMPINKNEFCSACGS